MSTVELVRTATAISSVNSRKAALLPTQVFASRYQQFFTKGSPAGQLLDVIAGAIQKLSDHSTSQASGKGDAKVSTEDRAAARTALRSQLDAISRTAKGLNLSDFWLSRERSDRSLVAMGRMFVGRAALLKDLFIGSHMAPDFIDKLNVAVENLEKTIFDQVFQEGTRITATSAINETRNAALAGLQRLDPLMENLLRDDPPALALWHSARHVERYTGGKRAKQNAAAEDPPITHTDAPAPTA
jgi:hypothetical protein